MKKLVLILSLLLSACGWNAVYSDASEYSVEVMPISGTDGIVMRNKLDALLNPSGDVSNPDYVLKVRMSSPGNVFKGIQKTGDATWQEIRISATYELKQGDKVVLTGSENVSESYTFVENLVAANSAARAAVDSSIRILSNKIALKVKVFLNSRNKE